VLTVTWVPLTVSKVTVTTLLAVAETSRVSQMVASHLVTRCKWPRWLRFAGVDDPTLWNCSA